MSTLSEALQRLYTRNIHVIKMGLEPMQALVEALDRPDQSFLVIHVAGTNGKGSVCAMMESVLRRAGFVTGLFTSPHLVRFNERIRVEGRCITDEELTWVMNRVDKADEEVAGQEGLRAATFFEYTTALALEHFSRSHVQVAILETGLGGRLDATNVVTPALSMITSIGLDHTMYLGDTPAQVAREKAGIIKAGKPVVCGSMDEEARGVVCRIAAERKSLLVDVEQSVSVQRKSLGVKGQKLKVESEEISYPSFVLPLLGDHQLANVASAIAGLETFGRMAGGSLPAEVICKGLAEVEWLGRCQVLEEEPLVVLDAAHNPQGAKVFKETLEQLAEGKTCGWVVGMSKEKDARAFLSTLSGDGSPCWLVPLENERAMPMEELETAATRAGLQVDVLSHMEAVNRAREWARKENGVIGVTGSIYLAGEMLERLDLSCYE